MTASNILSNLLLPLEPTLLKWWTLQNYYRISEVGILPPGERTELLYGHIALMAARGTSYVMTLRLLATTLDALLANAPVLVIAQALIQLDDFSEPETDLAIVQGNVQNYVGHHLQPAQVYLVLEVAAPTLKQDCEVKERVYAQTGIADYWVLNLNNCQLHICRGPTSTDYIPLTIPAISFLLSQHRLRLQRFPSSLFPFPKSCPR